MTPLPTLHLPDVTLVAVDTICHKLTALALQETLSKAKFGAVLLLSDKADAVHPLIQAMHQTFRWCQIKPCSLAAYNAHIWYSVPPLIRTSHYLIVQWDSWVLDPAAWTDDFLQYDYIGAPWGWHGDAHEVGNGGFSLRSRALGNTVAEDPASFAFAWPEDDTICRRHRPALERKGFKWAPSGVAYQFAYERTLPPALFNPFGYHGVFNWPRLMPPAQVHQRLALAPPHVLADPEVRAMLAALPLAGEAA